MKFTPQVPPRVFRVGPGTEIRDTGRMTLDPHEQVTFIGPQGSEYDVARMEWGYYATPSLNGRLPHCGLHAVLVKNEAHRHFVLLVENEKMDPFREWLVQERHEIVAWLDTVESLSRLAQDAAGSDGRISRETG